MSTVHVRLPLLRFPADDAPARSEAGSGPAVRQVGRGHRLARGADRTAHAPHQPPHRAPARAQARPPLAPRPPDARGPAPAAAQLPRPQGSRPLPLVDPGARPAPMIAPGSAAPPRALPDQDGNIVKRAALRGQTPLLVFRVPRWSRVG